MPPILALKILHFVMQCSCVFRVSLIMRSDYFCIQHSVFGLCGGSLIFLFQDLICFLKYYLYEFQM